MKRNKRQRKIGRYQTVRTNEVAPGIAVQKLKVTAVEPSLQSARLNRKLVVCIGWVLKRVLLQFIYGVRWIAFNVPFSPYRTVAARDELNRLVELAERETRANPAARSTRVE